VPRMSEHRSPHGAKAECGQECASLQACPGFRFAHPGYTPLTRLPFLVYHARMRKSVICVECLRCGHRGVLEADVLSRYGVPPDVTLAELSRRLVCEVCGSKALQVFRASPEEADAFLRG
jgi:hypothetical protein